MLFPYDLKHQIPVQRDFVRAGIRDFVQMGKELPYILANARVLSFISQIVISIDPT
jgi:hypothetical protein